MTYTVTIEETVAQDFQVEATSEEEAREIAKQKYDDGEFVLEPGEVICKQVGVVSPCDEEVEWEEF